MKTKSLRIGTALVLAMLVLAVAGVPTAKAVNIIANGSFETPTVPVGSFTLFASGSNAITDWTVVGPSGSSVAIISGTLTQFGFTFPAQDGVQWLDLTGLNSNTTDGVQQTVATTPGALYDLSFFVGNISNPGGLFGTTSTVGVQIDGGPVVSFTNSGGVGSTSQVWQQFTLPFTATAATTSITFINQDPPGDNTNGVDNVSLTLGQSTTPTTLLNISTRLNVPTGDNVLIGGFIVTGSAPKRVIVRAIGPSLSAFGVPDPLADPVLELHGPAGFVTIINDNWRDTQEVEIQATGLPPTNNLESAIVATLAPGAYTAIVRGNNNTTGVGLVEAYDLDQAANSQLANISTRGFVETSDNVMIGGFIIGGGGNSTIVVRGIGPSLTAFGVPNALADPTLELHDANGALISSNNNWQDDPVQAAIVTAAGLAPTNNLESAIAATLAPSQYTAVLAGQNNTTGVGLVEAYNLQ